MIRHVAAVLVLILVGFPLVVLPSRLVAVVALVAAALCAGGIAALSVPVLTAGATVAVIEYALALSLVGSHTDLAIAIVFGVALFLLLAMVDFMSRLRGAAAGADVLASMIRYWIAVAAVGAGVTIALAIGGTALAREATRVSYPVAVLGGALGALVAALGVIRLVTAPRGPAARDRAESDEPGSHNGSEP
jgi:hypothetical protein